MSARCPPRAAYLPAHAIPASAPRRSLQPRKREDFNFRFLVLRIGAALQTSRSLPAADLPSIARIPISSFVSVKGPSITSCFFHENLTRAALEVGCRPSPANITPALTNSSLNFPIPPGSSRHDSGFGTLGRFDKNHDFHVVSPDNVWARFCPGFLLSMTIKKAEGRHCGAIERGWRSRARRTNFAFNLTRSSSSGAPDRPENRANGSRKCP